MKHKHFYVSLLDDYHRRFQTFVQSCAFGEADKLRRNQLHFEKICDSIELFEYTVRTPSWLSKRNRPNPTQTQSSNPQGGENGNKRIRPNPIRSSSGDKVVNPNIDQQKRPPRNIRFGDVFNPSNREGIQETNHPDGQNKCNNYHHRGFRWSTCRYRNSHDKVLTPSELTSGRKYLSDLLGKYNAAHNTKNPSIPHGNPPTPPTQSTPKKENGESKKGPT